MNFAYLKNNNYGKLAADESGSIAIMFVVLLNMLLIAMALSLDIGRGYLARSNIGGASDAAALAAAITDDGAEAEKYFKANLPVNQYSINYEYEDDVTVTFDSAFRTVTVSSADFDIPTYFYNPDGDGLHNLEIANKSVVGMVGSAVQPADYFLILDESGSMGHFTTQSPITGATVSGNIALRHSVQIMIDEVFGSSGLPSTAYAMSFSSYATVATGTSGLKSDPLILNNILPQYTGANGSTCAACGVDAAFGIYDSSDEERLKIYVLMTDGEFNTTMDGETNVVLAKQEAVEKCDEIKAADNTVIWSIGFGSNSHGSEDALRECASSPDHYMYAPDGETLGQIFKQIAVVTGRLRILE